ncbi:hypothetical protein [Streptomyces sp. NBC_01314]|uniref:hypothetical protein n=1 Tax=Streptomyces sp. NBC_01314 TaxID=2903821 RepID=UPI00308F9DBF|nr:hypothetical protein OG622_13995 [Streptomyces sp. NBC_01314]
MSRLECTVIDLNLPVSSTNRTVILITGEQEALLVDAGFTRADSHRLAAEILDSGKKLITGSMSTPYEKTGFAVSTFTVPAEAVRRPCAGNTPAPTQKGLPQ